MCDLIQHFYMLHEIVIVGFNFTDILITIFQRFTGIFLIRSVYGLPDFAKFLKPSYDLSIILFLFCSSLANYGLDTLHVLINQIHTRSSLYQ